MVAAQRSPKSPHKRLQSDTRLDVLNMMTGSVKRQDSLSPKDSLSPCDEYFEDRKSCDKNGDAISISITPPERPQDLPDGKPHTTTRQEHSLSASASHLPIRSSSLQRKHALPNTPSHANPTTTAREPRSRPSRSPRPSALVLDSSCGFTTQSPHDLRRTIRRTASCASKTHSIHHCSPPPSPPTSSRAAAAPPPVPPKSLKRNLSSYSSNMGNQHSHPAGADSAIDDGDDTSLHSVVRSPKGKTMRLPRRSSMGNVFKRLDAKSPLPQDFSATVIEVPRAATAPNLDGMGEDDDSEEFADDEKERGRARHAHRHSAPSPTIPVHPASPATMTEESAARPLSTADTITDHDRAQYDDEETEALRVSALSPTLPSPSPLPEDSPSKYGLKDRMDTPEAPPSPPDINVIKARRRSSGLEIFNEARSLQSASSFLNGLSTARRRAESRAGATSRSNLHSSQSRNLTDLSASTSQSYATTTASASYATFLPASTNASNFNLTASYSNNTSTPYLHPSTASASHLNLLPPPSPPDGLLSRNLGHSTKSSGFAHARPMTVTQNKCFRSHARLLISRNRHAPVECAVCHRDDEQDHFMCSWCALRMCGGCRRDFGKRGVMALQERVRGAEMGWDDGEEGGGSGSGSSGEEFGGMMGGRMSGLGRR